VHDVLMNMGPLLAFGLVPVWIPLVGTLVGAAFDSLRPRETTPAERAVQEAKRRSEALRTVQPSSFSASSALAR
jgi:hypothetical protein